MASTEDIPDATLDAIFSCAVCGDRFSDVYKGHTQDVGGLSDGINRRDRLVTRLYVGACCHVICIKHIGDGAGPAFHAAGKRPSAPCPVCIGEGHSDQPRELFSVRGFEAGEYDPAIPKDWFSTPPSMLLNAKDRDGETVRFHYLALRRYIKHADVLLKRTQEDLAHTQTKLLLVTAAPDHERIDRYQKEIERLRPFEEEARRLRSERSLMKERLASAGIPMPLQALPSLPEDMVVDERGCFVHPEMTPTISESSAVDLGLSLQPHPRPLKRVRPRSPSHDQQAAPSSADMMPPPPKPPGRIMSMRKSIPQKLREKFLSKPVPPRNDFYLLNESPVAPGGGTLYSTTSRTFDARNSDADMFRGVHDPREPQSDRQRSIHSRASQYDQERLETTETRNPGPHHLAEHRQFSGIPSRTYRTLPDPLRSHATGYPTNEFSHSDKSDPITPPAVLFKRPAEREPDRILRTFRHISIAKGPI
ncbi:unnamed protein product [Periconia digitata]|uniref:Uncharacterized protein n=1 Tax=Periconia digitata TaxID=1303443 RepID=A0A9W4UMC3_9PLEO|nr:unnamed protein product [Periconia digitata]